MRRFVSCVTLAGLVLAAPAVHADVKTREKSSFKLEGLLGGIVRMFGGGGNTTATVAVKGSRMAQIDDTTGQIIDLAEEKVYTLDMKKKEYRVVTFAEMRAELEKMRAEAEKSVADMKPEEKAEMEQAGRSLDLDVAVKDTGERRRVAGHDTRKVILTVTAREKDRTMEQGGGFVMTSEMWLAPVIPALEEITDFHARYAKAVYGDVFGLNPQQAASLMAMFPSFGGMAERMQAESAGLEGTALMTVTTFETVKSEEQMKEAAQQQQSGGGGIGGGVGGALARRMMGNRGQVQQRTKAMTMTSEITSIATAVADADVTMPNGFKEKK